MPGGGVCNCPVYVGWVRGRLMGRLLGEGVRGQGLSVTLRPRPSPDLLYLLPQS